MEYSRKSRKFTLSFTPVPWTMNSLMNLKSFYSEPIKGIFFCNKVCGFLLSVSFGWLTPICRTAVDATDCFIGPVPLHFVKWILIDILCRGLRRGVVSFLPDFLGILESSSKKSFDISANNSFSSVLPDPIAFKLFSVNKNFIWLYSDF